MYQIRCKWQLTDSIFFLSVSRVNFPDSGHWLFILNIMSSTFDVCRSTTLDHDLVTGNSCLLLMVMNRGLMMNDLLKRIEHSQ